MRPILNTHQYKKAKDYIKGIKKSLPEKFRYEILGKNQEGEIVFLWRTQTKTIGCFTIKTMPCKEHLINLGILSDKFSVIERLKDNKIKVYSKKGEYFFHLDNLKVFPLDYSYFLDSLWKGANEEYLVSEMSSRHLGRAFYVDNYLNSNPHKGLIKEIKNRFGKEIVTKDLALQHFCKEGVDKFIVDYGLERKTCLTINELLDYLYEDRINISLLIKQAILWYVNLYGDIKRESKPINSEDMKNLQRLTEQADISQF